MATYTSKYTGAQIDETVEKVLNGKVARADYASTADSATSATKAKTLSASTEYVTTNSAGGVDITLAPEALYAIQWWDECNYTFLLYVNSSESWSSTVLGPNEITYLFKYSPDTGRLQAYYKPADLLTYVGSLRLLISRIASIVL